jgi:hypothetical protein
MVLMMSKVTMDRFLRSTMTKMIQNNQTKIRCPCRRFKLKRLMDPKSEKVQDHMLMCGFMDGYLWLGDEDDHDVVHGARQEMRKGNKTLTTRASENTNNLSDMITKEMPDTVIM